MNYASIRNVLRLSIMQFVYDLCIYNLWYQLTMLLEINNKAKGVKDLRPQ